MAVEIPVFQKSFEATGDLSAAQYKFVKYDGNVGDTGCPRVIVCTGATDIPIGVLQNKPNATGVVAEVLIIGETKVQADASIAVGDQIGTSADGQADAKTVTTDATEYVVGRVSRAAGAAGRYASAIINCCNPHRAA